RAARFSHCSAALRKVCFASASVARSAGCSHVAAFWRQTSGRDGIVVPLLVRNRSLAYSLRRTCAAQSVQCVFRHIVPVAGARNGSSIGSIVHLVTGTAEKPY